MQRFEGSRMGAIRWAATLAARDARGSRTKALLYALSMSLGIAALVAMGSFGSDLQRAVDDQARELLGADFSFLSRQPFNDDVLRFIDSIPGETSHYTSFVSMASFPEQDLTQLVRIRAVEGDFPFYGELETEPADAAARFREGPYVLVDQGLMDRIGAKVGEKLKLGRTDFTIAGRLARSPGDTFAAAMLGPRLYMNHRYLADTGLIQQGSRVFYSQAFKLPKGMDADAFAKEHEAFLKEQRLRWDTVSTRKASIGEAMGNLTNYLNLVACLALLLGGLGVAGAVHYHIKQKTRQVATLRCLGATQFHVMMVFLIQVGAMALMAIVLGTALGVAFQFLLPRMLGELMPISFSPAFQPGAVAVAAIWGLVMSLTLAVAPLLRLRKVSPVNCFRPERISTRRDLASWAAYGTVVVCWWLFAIFRTGSLKQGSAFIGSLLASIALLYLVARILGFLARRMVSDHLPFSWRHGLANLFRPQNQTFVFLVILGMGTFLLTVLAGARTMLLDGFRNNLSQDRPNFIAFDIQPDQVDGVMDAVRGLQLPVDKAVPIVPMRLNKIKGRPVTEYMDHLPEWTLQREYRSTYRENLTETETLTAGHWYNSAGPGVKIIPVSLEEDIAETLEVGLYDSLEMDVLGLPLELVVTSLRKVDWNSMQPNFFIVFPAGVLEDAPQMFVLTTRTTSREQVNQLQNVLVEGWPNISCVDMSEVVRTIDEVIGRAQTVVRFLAALCIGTGFLLLASTIWNSRFERLAEWALLRTLGATRRQMASMVLVEYCLLGLFAALTGALLAVCAIWALGVFLFEVDPFPRPWALLPPVLALPPLTLLLGYLGQRGLWHASPRYVLRQED